MKIAILISYIIHALFFIALAYLLYKESQALASAAKIKTLISSAISRPITAPAYKSARAEAQAAIHTQNTARLIDICTPKARNPNFDPATLNSWCEPCGILASPLGEYIIKHKHEMIKTEQITLQRLHGGNLNSPGFFIFDAVSRACRKINFQAEFGFSEYFFCLSASHNRGNIIGTANDGSIKDRLNHLKRQHQDQLNRSKKKPQTQKKRAAA